jgi:hypothetical protein
MHAPRVCEPWGAASPVQNCERGVDLTSDVELKLRTRRGPARQGWARLGKARLGAVRHGLARQGKGAGGIPGCGGPLRRAG